MGNCVSDNQNKKKQYISTCYKGINADTTSESRQRCEANIKTDLEGIRSDYVDWVYLALGREQ
jgi:hypothetical protein